MQPPDQASTEVTASSRCMERARSGLPALPGHIIGFVPFQD